jgi:hypothetical protein
MGIEMRVLKAHVRGGRVVLDEPTDLPEGTEIQLVPVDDYGMTSEERDALDAALDEAEAEGARGEVASLDELRAALRASR